MKYLSRSQAATVIAVALVILSFYSRRHFISYRPPARSSQVSPVGVVVRVSGKVRSPGTYSFDRQVTVSQAVSRAGGLISGLTPESRWTSLHVAHARHLHFIADAYGTARLRLGWMAVPSRLALGVPIDVNQASASDLAEVPGISPGLAERIVAQRRQLGVFSRLDELDSVKGIGSKTLKRLRPLLGTGVSGGKEQ